MSEIRILYVDDYPLDRELVRDALEKEHGGFRVAEAASRAEFEAQLAKGDFDLVLSDFNILGFEGLQVIEAVHAKDPRIPVVIVTGTGSEEIAVEALKRGATDYVIKTPKHIRRLPLMIQAALEKKKLEEERAHAEQERDRLFNYSIDLLCIAGFDGYFKQINPAWERTLGWTNDELMSKPYIEFVHPEDRQATTQAAGNLVDGKLVFSFENRYMCKDGAYKWLAWNSYPLAEENLIFAVAHDVTHRKRTEEAERSARIHAETLAAASQSLTQSLELESVLDTLLEHLRQVVHYDGANIMLLENESHLRIRSARGYEKLGGLGKVRTMVFDAHNTPNLWRVMQTKQSCVVNDTDAEPDWIFLEGVEHVRSWLGVPLIVNDHIIGLCSLDKAEPDFFTPKEIKLVESLTPQAAMAIHNASLFETAQEELSERKRAEEHVERQLQRLSALTVIDRMITSSMDLKLTLNIFLENAAKQLGADAAAILLHNPHQHTLEFAAGRGFRGGGITQLHLRVGEGYSGKAALERRVISLPDITKADPPFVRAHLIAGEGFVAFYAVPLIAKGQIKGVLEIFHRARLNPDQEWLDFLDTLAGQAAIAIDNAELFNKLHRSNAELMRAYDATIEGWSRALDLRDKETEGHTQRVTEMTLRLAQAMGQTDEELIHIRRGSLLHDIGKLGVPDGILLKPDKLTDDEWVVMKKHAQYAYDMLLPIDYLRHALDIPYCHHEKWDGTGYPRGLKGEEIPLAARIFAVVDVWDALRSDRPYRKGWSEGEVRQHIRQHSGVHFDPQVVEVFLKLSA